MDFNEIKDYLKELMANDDNFWDVFNAEDYYSRIEGAFKDEGDDWECDFCDFQFDSSECVEPKQARESMEDHLREEHTWDILMKEVKKLAAAMGFPKEYQFMGNQQDQVKQIGNAVAVNMARSLISSLLESQGRR